MAVVIEMPKLSDTMEEGGVAEWFKKEGEFVEEGDLLLSVETDKATMEYNSPEEGTLLKIVVQPGTTVRLRKPIAVLGEKGELPDYDVLLKDVSTASDRVDDGDSSKSSAEGSSPVEPAPVSVSASEDGVSDRAQIKSGVVSGSAGRVKASPLAKKLAAQKGLDLRMLSGTGPMGRIVQKDVEQAALAPISVGYGVPAYEDKVIPNSMMRKTIAKRLLAGKNEAPHFYLTVSADMGAILDWRQNLNQDPGVLSGQLPKVSVNDLVILAVAHGLRRHPEVNASWSDNAITHHGRVDVCMAVALPTGLVTPVIRNADQLKVRTIAEQSKALAKKARDGLLTPEEYTGGTFTISNLGMTKVESFTAIINPPQACILAVGSTQTVPWVDEKEQLVVRKRMQMTLSCDHRVVDGMVGAKFLETLISYLENPLLMLS